MDPSFSNVATDLNVLPSGGPIPTTAMATWGQKRWQGSSTGSSSSSYHSSSSLRWLLIVPLLKDQLHRTSSGCWAISRASWGETWTIAGRLGPGILCKFFIYNLKQRAEDVKGFGREPKWKIELTWLGEEEYLENNSRIEYQAEIWYRQLSKLNNQYCAGELGRDICLPAWRGPWP